MPCALDNRSRARPRAKVGALLALGILLSTFAPSSAFAGSGTPVDPWLTLNIHYLWSNNGGPSNTFQDIKAQSEHASYVEFWAYNARLTSGSQYLGMQTQGTLKGARNGEVVSKSVHFSMFGNGQPIFNLEPTYCSAGADRLPGLSCAKSFGWGVNTTYRFTINYYYGITTPGWCTPGLPSCTVAQGLVAGTQIAAFSYYSLAYGTAQGASSFLEIPLATGGTCAAPTPSGEFIVPFKTIGGNLVPVTTVTGFDRSTEYPQTCARTYNQWVATYMHY